MLNLCSKRKRKIKHAWNIEEDRSLNYCGLKLNIQRIFRTEKKRFLKLDQKLHAIFPLSPYWAPLGPPQSLRPFYFSNHFIPKEKMLCTSSEANSFSVWNEVTSLEVVTIFICVSFIVYITVQIRSDKRFAESI